MKRFLAVTAALVAMLPAAAAAEVGVSITVGQPGFYGHIDIGDFPQPRLIYRDPIVIHQGIIYRRPAYLHVPPGHAKNWGKHCHKYDACGHPVYFVTDNWYNGVYVPEYQRKHGKAHGKDHHPSKGGKGNKGGKGKK